MKSRIINFKDLKVEFSNRYNVIEQDGTKTIKTIEYNPGIIYESGTPETAENFNAIQSNCVYEVDGIRILEGQEEIYDISIDGFDNFIFSHLKIILKPDTTNTKKGCFIRLNNEKYLIKNHLDSVEIGQIFKDENIPLTLNSSKKTADIIGAVNGGVTATLKDVVDMIRNHCPYRIGDMLTTTLMENPALTWIGTTWQKIEGKYLKGTSGNENSKITGGSNTKILSTANIPSHGHTATGTISESGKHTHTANHGHTATQPAHTHTANHSHTGTAAAHTHTANHGHTATQPAHAHTQPAHTHTVNLGRGVQGEAYHTGIGGSPIVTINRGTTSNGGENTGSATPAITVATTNVTTSSSTPTLTINTTNVTTSDSTPAITVATTNVTTSEVSNHTHGITISTASVGEGKSFNVEPEYYTVNHWLRIA